MRHRLACLLIVIACGDKKASEPEIDAAPEPIDAPPPDAPPPIDAFEGVFCALKDPVVQLGFTCHIVWSQCTDQATYDLDCRIQNVGGNVFSLCDCTLNGAPSGQFISTTICSSTTFGQVEAIANPECGWDLR
jgi:hypothetical protein